MSIFYIIFNWVYKLDCCTTLDFVMEVEAHNAPDAMVYFWRHCPSDDAEHISAQVLAATEQNKRYIRCLYPSMWWVECKDSVFNDNPPYFSMGTGHNKVHLPQNLIGMTWSQLDNYEGARDIYMRMMESDHVIHLTEKDYPLDVVMDDGPMKDIYESNKDARYPETLTEYVERVKEEYGITQTEYEKQRDQRVYGTGEA